MFDSGETGQLGIVAVEVIDNDGGVAIGPTTSDIAESGSTGIYLWNCPAAPADLGQYTIVWSISGDFTEDSVGIDTLVVVEQGAQPLPPIPAPADGGYPHGPCTAWTTTQAVLDMCALQDVENVDLLPGVIMASQVLFELSGRQFAGVCSNKVRPCRNGCGCDWQMLSRGYVIWLGDSWGCNSDYCGCGSLSRVELAGYPVTSINEVKIDGIVVDPSEYRIDAKRFLTHMNGGSWPSCQALDLPDTASGTFSVSYSHGQNPPAAGQLAATELACDIYKAGTPSGAADCAMPSSVTRVSRQGVTIERNAFAAWGRQLGAWRTGMPLVDLFLNAYNPAGIRRRPVFMTPGRRAYPLNAGE